MQLTDDDITEFIRVWEADFGETLTPDQARQHASAILTLYLEVARGIADRETGARPKSN